MTRLEALREAFPTDDPEALADPLPLGLPPIPGQVWWSGYLIPEDAAWELNQKLANGWVAA